MDDILVPDRVLQPGEKQQVVSLRCERKDAGRKAALQLHSQALQVAGPRKYGEVLHHVGPSQHPETRRE